MSVISLRQPQRLNRPEWPFSINTDSWQSHRLLAWIPGGAFTEMVRGSHVVAGAPTPNQDFSAFGSGYGTSEAATGFWSFPAITGVRVPFTLSVWARPTSGSSGSASFQSSGAGTAVYNGVLFRTGLSGVSVWQTSFGTGGGEAAGNRRSAAGSSQPTATVPHHYLVVCRGATDWSLYLDGQAETPTYSGTGGTLTNATTNGNMGRASGTSVVGVSFYDVRIYDYAMDANQAMSLYDPGSRWDLYWKPSNRTYFFLADAAAKASTMAIWASMRS